VKAGATTNNSVTVTIRSLYGFTGTVSLSCKVNYVGSGTDASPPTCSFATNPLAVNGSDVSTQLVVSTTAAPAGNKKTAVDGALGKTGLVFWGGALLLLMPARRSYRWLGAAMLILVVSGPMLSLSSCGGTSAALPPTTPPGAGVPPPTNPPGSQTGNYIVTVSATSDTAVTPPPPVTVQLTVD
jgi:hypothetical protein